MIQISPQTRVFVALQAVDFRKGIDGLAAVCRQLLSRDPMSGTLFLFRNKARTSLRILAYDGQGFWLCTKRLSQGRFRWWPQSTESTRSIDCRELQTLIWNGDPSKANFSDEWKQIKGN